MVGIRGLGFIDKTGKEVVPCIFDQATDYSEGLAYIRKGELVGFVNKEGKKALWKRREFDGLY